MDRQQQWHEMAARLSRFPWRTTLRTLRDRFREDRLDLTVASLTYTTLLALVPFFTVVLAIFTAFPMFSELQQSLGNWFVQSLIPESIAQTVLGYISQFSSQASHLGVVGLLFLFVTSIALILTMDRTLNNIWRVRRLRPLGQRILVYWAALTMGPLFLGLSLSMTSHAISASHGLVAALPFGVELLIGLFQFTLFAFGMTCLFRYVPNTQVKWVHATAGGVFVALGLWAAKKLLAVYLVNVPTYSVIYGAFATLPVLLVWIYLVWAIVLLGAVIAAYLPGLCNGIAHYSDAAGWRFRLALQVLRRLQQARETSAGMQALTLMRLAQDLQAESPQLTGVLESLVELGWVGELSDSHSRGGGDAGFVLLAQLDVTLQPLVDKLLLTPAPEVQALWSRWADLRLADVVRDDVYGSAV